MKHLKNIKYKLSPGVRGPPKKEKPDWGDPFPCKDERLASLGWVASLARGQAHGVQSEKVKHGYGRGDPYLSPDTKILKICSAISLKNVVNLILATVLYI